MDRDEVWAAIDDQRITLAFLLARLTPQQWSAPSQCEGWTVRDVAAHLTLSHIGLGRLAVELVRAGGSFDRMVRSTARRHARIPTDELVAELRAMAGSRRHPLGTSYLDPLVDVLVHGQDIARPLRIARQLPVGPSAVAAARVWRMGVPFDAQKRVAGLRLIATDTEWAEGTGAEVTGRIGSILLVLTGRRVAASELNGTGVAHLVERGLVRSS